jgi:hypothetical protein
MQAIAISLLPVVATLDILRSEIDLAIGRDGEYALSEAGQSDRHCHLPRCLRSRGDAQYLVGQARLQTTPKALYAP